MSKEIKSARGVSVNFDLLKIKQQIATTPKTTVVQAREEFIDKKFSRRVKKVNRQLADLQIDTSPKGKVDPVDVSDIDDLPDDLPDDLDHELMQDENVETTSNTQTTRPKRIIRNRTNATDSNS